MMTSKNKESMNHKQKYVAVGCHKWNHQVYDEIIRLYPGNWYYVGDKNSLTLEYINSISPRYLFFLHWSWKVPREIIQKYECVCFHMTDLPYGRGGSPLQNLIMRGHKNTKITAFRMNEEYDSGPVYMKSELVLDGRAEDIYLDATRKSAEMIKTIINNESKPLEQEGAMTLFERRSPDQSEIPKTASLEELYDFIRMLDAEGYPKAFINYKNIRLELYKAEMKEDRIIANVNIKRMEKL